MGYLIIFLFCVAVIIANKRRNYYYEEYLVDEKRDKNLKDLDNIEKDK